MNYLIYGTSYKLIDREIDKIVGTSEYRTISFADVGIKDILEDISYTSLFSEKKIIVLKNCEILFATKKEKSDDLERFLSFIKREDESTSLIMTSTTKPTGKSKWNKDFIENVKVIETPEITKSYELAKFLENYLKSENYYCERHVLDEFAVKCASNIDIALMELEKIFIIKGENRTITASDIEKYTSNYNSSDTFGLKDAILGKDIARANELLDDLENSKMDALAIIVMLAKEYQLVYDVKALALQKMPNEQIGTKLDNMHPYRVKILQAVGAKYTLSELEKLILYLCNIDLKMVTEDNLGYSEIRKFLLYL